MTKHEITRKLDEIVDFAGVERYLDTPVKRYSSGMTVRLGFAVAAFLEPEILVVDEVLTVGDAEFQKKAIGKMQDVSKGEGRTVLFVSHNMAAVRNLCNTGVLLKNGMIQNFGLADAVIDEYILENKDNLTNDLSNWKKRRGNGKAKFLEVNITSINGNLISTLLTGSDYIFNFKIEVFTTCSINLGFSFFSAEDVMISNIVTRVSAPLPIPCSIIFLGSKALSTSWAIP